MSCSIRIYPLTQTAVSAACVGYIPYLGKKNKKCARLDCFTKCFTASTAAYGCFKCDMQQNKISNQKIRMTIDHQDASEDSTFSGCDCSHVTASNQSERVATVSCSQSAASLQNNRKQFATKLLIRYSWLWLPTRIGCLLSRDYSRSQKK